MNFVITGSEGFIGEHLRRELEDSGHHVWGYDIRNDMDALDAEQFQATLEKHRPDIVVHLADGHSGDVTEAVRDTVAMTAVVASECFKASVRLVYASTVGVDNPYSLHTISKRAGEEICRLYAWEAPIILRFALPYGPGLGPGRSELIEFLDLAHRGEEITVRDGTRSWCWIGDAVKAARIAIERGDGVYDIGREDDPTSLRAAAEMACVIAGASKSLITYEDRPSDAPAVSPSRIRSLGWSPTVPLYEGMTTTYQEWIVLPHETGTFA